MKRFRSVPGPARAAYVIAALAAVAVAGLGFAAEILNPPSIQELDRGGPAYVAAGLVIVLILIVTPPALIGALLSSESAETRRTGAILAAVTGLIGVLAALRAPLPVDFPGTGDAGVLMAVRAGFGLAAAGLCLVSYFGLRDAGRSRKALKAALPVIDGS